MPTGRQREGLSWGQTCPLTQSCSDWQMILSFHSRTTSCHDKGCHGAGAEGEQWAAAVVALVDVDFVVAVAVLLVMPFLCCVHLMPFRL